MNAQETINRSIFFLKCQIKMLFRWYVTRPKCVKISNVRLNINHDVLSSPMVKTLYRGYYELDEQDILDNTLESGDKVLELGAGIGFISSYAAKKIGDASVTVCEANPELIQIIKENHQANGFDIDVHNCILSHKKGSIDFYIAKNFWASSLVPAPDRRKVQVSMALLDEMIITSQSNYLVIDIEGGEESLLNQPDYDLPPIVNKICIELHPSVIGDISTSNVVSNLLRMGFILELSKMSCGFVAYFTRDLSGNFGNN